MAEGHVAFLGSTKEAVQNFEQLGRPCPALHNPAEHFVRELAVETKSQLEDRARIAVRRLYAQLLSFVKILSES